ncbi:MAG: nucleotidyltransferase family protein [Rhodospirillales bacterium]|nr:MAG: nucleotidyltransferase family protein [Rhodospirillales bacterium]
MPSPTRNGNPDVARVAALIAADAEIMARLRAVRALALPDGWIGAGFIRDRIWDRLAGLEPRPSLDVDVVYFDAVDPEGAREAAHEARLDAESPGVDWQVRNQARMHRRNRDAPYRDTADAMAHWLETPTAIAARLDGSDVVEILAPCGVGDLLGLVCRPTAAGRAKPGEYRDRVVAKRWRERFPAARIVDPDGM